MDEPPLVQTVLYMASHPTTLHVSYFAGCWTCKRLFICTCCRSRWDQYNSVTLWSTVLLEKLTDAQVVKKFFTFYETQKFLIVFTTACQFCVLPSNINPVHTLPFCLRSILILPCHLCLDLQSGLFPSGCCTRNPLCIFAFFSPIHAACLVPSHPWFASTNHEASHCAVSSILLPPPLVYIQTFPLASNSQMP